MNKTPIVCYEYGKTDVTDYVKSQYTRYKESTTNTSAVIGDYEERNISIIDSKYLKNGCNNVGILETENYRFEFRPKMDNPEKSASKNNLNSSELPNDEHFWHFLPKMLKTLYDYENMSDKMFIDPRRRIILPKGCSIAPLLTLSYVAQCDSILRKGLLKKYVRRSERLKTIKGRIDFNALAKNKPWDVSSIPCKYTEMSMENEENSIMLYCAYKLLSELRDRRVQNNQIHKKLREQYTLLLTEINFSEKTYADWQRLNQSSLSKSYLNMMELCGAILNDSMFSFDENSNKKIQGVNFVIDMDWVFEQYLTTLFKKVVLLEKFNDKITIKDQKIGKLCDSGKIRIKPDLIIRETKNGRALAVLDFKWKSRSPNSDFYQIICYALAELQKHGESKKIDACLCAVYDEKIDNTPYDKISKVFKSEKEILIKKKVFLNSESFSESNDEKIESRICDKIETYLDILICESS